MTSVCRERHQSSPCGARCLDCFKLTIEPTKIPAHPLYLDPSGPLPAIFVPSYSSIPRRAPSPRDILPIFEAGCDAEIHASVIKRVMRDMVNFNTVVVNESHQLTMETKGRRPSSDHLLSMDVAISSEAPTVLAGPLRVGRVNQGVGADAPIRAAKRNASRNAVRQDLNITATTGLGRPLAGPCAVIPLPQTRRPDGKRFATRKTGSIQAHRASPSLGVAPRNVVSIAGAFACLNFTIGGRDVRRSR
jgi:hypothetical protein